MSGVAANVFRAASRMARESPKLLPRAIADNFKFLLLLNTSINFALLGEPWYKQDDAVLPKIVIPGSKIRAVISWV